MGLHTFLGVMSSMKCVSVSRVSMVGRLLVISSVVMLSGFSVMTSGMRMMF